VANAISGAGALVQNGGDTVTLTGTTCPSAELSTSLRARWRLGARTRWEPPAGAVQSGATLDVSGYSIGNAITVNGGVLQASSGAGGT
jgi:hypothetical protein